MTILRSELVHQCIDRRSNRFDTFIKEMVMARGRIPLSMVRKRVANAANDKATVLLIHGFGQNRYTWHLPSRSFANHLASIGFDVFNLDLRGQGRSRLMGAPRPKLISEYVEEDVPRALEEILAITKRQDVFMIGHSLGGLISYASSPLATGLIQGVATIGSPYVFTKGSGILTFFAGLIAKLENHGVHLGNLPIPVKLVGKLLRNLRPYLETPLYPVKLRGWHAGAIEPEILAEHLNYAFDLASLEVMLTMFRWSGGNFGGRNVLDGDGESYSERFERSHLPLMVIAGTVDDLAPPPSVEPAYIRSRSSMKAYRELPLGHIDLVVGRDAPKSTWLILERWMTQILDEQQKHVISSSIPPETYSLGDEDMPGE